MSQLELLPQAPTLTPRQTEALAFLRSCGTDGCTGYELGVAMGVRPDYAKSNGLQWLRALKRKGMARQLKGGIWRAVDAKDDGKLPPGMTDQVPY